MKAMIWKELRENFKWAALAFLGLLLAEIYALSTEQKNFDISSDFTLCGSAFLMTTAFGCSLVGAALGMVQILPERHQDQWAALLHRPVPRSVIFLGKTLPGLALYFLATALPLLASVCYVAIPGNFPAPLVPGMMLPALSDLSLGVVFYFGAILTCLHRGRWFGAKMMIMVAVVPVLLLHIMAGNAFLVLPLTASLILMLAAWGALLGNGPVGSMPRVGRMSYVLVVLAGAGTVLAVLALCAEFLAGEGASREDYDLSQFEVTKDGQVFAMKESLFAKDGSGMELTDMQGKPVTDERYLGNGSYEYLSRFIPIVFDMDKDALRWDEMLRRFPRNSGNYIRPMWNSPYDTEYWYILARGNFLVGYDKLSRRQVGFFDREGFKSPGQKPVPFSSRVSISLYSNGAPTLLTSGSRVYAADLSDRNMSTFFDAGNGVVYGAERFAGGGGGSGRIAVALEGGIRILDGKGGQLCAIPYPHDPRRWGNISITTDKALNHIYLQSAKTYLEYNNRDAVLPAFLDEYDFKGNLLHTYSLPGTVISPEPTGWVERIVNYSAPLGPLAVAEIFFRLDPIRNYEQEGLQLLPADFASQLDVLSVIALGLAAATFFWARKTGFSKGAALRWAAFVFVFGPAGLLAFRVAADWPVRLRCPSCGKKRAIESERCMHCHQAWILPEPNGTEILDAPVPQEL